MFTQTAMKNLLAEIKKCAQNKYVTTYCVTTANCDANGRLNLIVLLKLIENAQEEPANCLAKVAPEYKKDLLEVSFKLYETASAGDLLELDARFYEIDRRTVLLKIFVRKIRPDKSTKRVCRASYAFKAVFNQEAA